MKKYIVILKAFGSEDYITVLSEGVDSLAAVANAEIVNPGYSYYSVKEYKE